MAMESIPGGFGLVYPVLKALEERGRIRRGYFVSGLGATQFALPGALDRLRALRDAGSHNPDEERDRDLQPDGIVLGASDPANPYGATLKWPAVAATQASHTADTPKAGRGPTRTVGATVVLVDGTLAAYLGRGDRYLLTWIPESEPARSKTAQALARVLIDRARSGGEAPRGMLIEEIDGLPPAAHPLAPFLTAAGFIAGALGFQPTFGG
jgi:ATP-dependent Lhr-like helicase